MRDSRIRGRRLRSSSVVGLIAGLAAVATVAGGVSRADAGSSAPPPLTLPSPTGASPVGTRTLRVVDTTRTDPYAPTRRARELLLSLWYPSAGGGSARAPYLALSVAKVYAKESGVPATVLAALSMSARSGAPPRPGRHPVVLFSPGFGGSSAEYTLLLEDLASHGYIVVAIDHTYEAPLVFPGGRLVLPSQRVLNVKRATSVRRADARFVLTRLAQLNRQGPLAGRLDLNRVAALGHSLGGATAASLMLAERRVIAGANMDGTFMGRVADVGLDRPFMVMSENRGKRGDLELGVDRFAMAQRGPLVTVKFRGVGHLGFSDLLVLVPQLAKYVPAIRKALPVGKADPARTLPTQRAYLLAFFDTYLRDRPSPLLCRACSPTAGVDVAARPAR